MLMNKKRSNLRHNDIGYTELLIGFDDFPFFRLKKKVDSAYVLLKIFLIDWYHSKIVSSPKRLTMGAKIALGASYAAKKTKKAKYQ